MNMSVKKKCWKMAIYIRLSKDDGNEISSSVKNQEIRIRAFLSEFKEPYEIAGIYTDDGYTGTDTDRNAFQKMITHIYQHKINCVIVKDLSRFSRNIADASYYLENLFVEYNIRFISVELPYLDSVKYPDQMNSILVPMQNLINDDFCRQTSVKIRSVLNTKRKNGQFIGAFPPYGYKKDIQNKNKLLPDEDAEVIVQNIFKWYVHEGFSKNAIAKKLNELGIPNPSSYKKLKGLNYVPPKPSDGLWSTKTISHILNNEVYTGTMVQGKYRVKSYKVHQQINTPKEEWYIVPQTHTAIISPEIFQKAKSMQNANAKQPENKKNIHTLSGFIYCADCHKAMVRIQGGSSNKFAYYVCRTYREKSQKKCTKHSVRTDKLENILLILLNTQLNLLEIRIKKYLPMPSSAPTEKWEKAISYNLKQLEKLQKAKDFLYVDFHSGELSLTDYTRMKDTFMEKEIRIRGSVANLENEIKNIKNIANQSFNNQFQELNRHILSEFVIQVKIHQNKSVTLCFSYKDIYRNTN